MQKTLIILLIICAIGVYGHTAGGVDRHEGKYLLDLGFDPEVPKAGEPVTLNFEMKEQDRPVPVDRIDLILKKDGDVFYQGSVPGDNDEVTIRLPEGGEYTIFAEYVLDEEVVAATDFPLVLQEESWFRGIYIPIAAVTLLFVVLGIIEIRKRR